MFREALRLYPPITFIPRVAAQDVEVAGVKARKGAMIMIAPWTIHRHRELWRDADRFDPDRFAEPAQKRSVAEAYLPFGMGPRICVGAAFATIESGLILARLVRAFDFEALEPDRVRPVARLTRGRRRRSGRASGALKGAVGRFAAARVCPPLTIPPLHRCLCAIAQASPRISRIRVKTPPRILNICSSKVVPWRARWVPPPRPET